MKAFWNLIVCWWSGHDWTYKMKEGIPASFAELFGGMGGFKSYATMYCKRCGEKSRYS